MDSSGFKSWAEFFGMRQRRSEGRRFIYRGRGASSENCSNAFRQASRRNLNDLLSLDELRASIASETHFFKSVQHLLRAVQQGVEERHLDAERVEACYRRMSAEADRIRRRTSAHVHQTDLVFAKTLREAIVPLAMAVANEEPWLLDDRVGQSLSIIEARQRELAKILSRIGPQFDACLSEIDLKQAVPSIVDFHQLGAGRLIKMSSSVQTDKVIRMDERRFESILDNLILNALSSIEKAIQFEGRTAGRLDVETRSTKSFGTEYLEFEAADNGIGFASPEDLSVPDPNCPHGTGLHSIGRLARFYNGYLNVSKRHGGGATVTVGLSLALIPEVAAFARKSRRWSFQ